MYICSWRWNGNVFFVVDGRVPHSTPSYIASMLVCDTRCTDKKSGSGCGHHAFYFLGFSRNLLDHFPRQMPIKGALEGMLNAAPWTFSLHWLHICQLGASEIRPKWSLIKFTEGTTPSKFPGYELQWATWKVIKPLCITRCILLLLVPETWGVACFLSDGIRWLCPWHGVWQTLATECWSLLDADIWHLWPFDVISCKTVCCCFCCDKTLLLVFFHKRSPRTTLQEETTCQELSFRNLCSACVQTAANSLC